MSGTIKGITIEIDGNTQPLNKAMEGVNKRSKDLQSELRQVERLLKLDPSNTVLLEQKQKLLAESVDNTKTKLDKLKESEKQVQQQFAEGKVGEEQYRAIQREVIAAEKEFEKLDDQLKEVNSKWKGAGEALQDVGGKISSVGKGMTVGVTAPIVAIGAASMAAFNEVDAGLDTIVTKTGASGEAMDGLQGSFEKVYGSIPADAQAVGDAIGEVNTQFGLTGQALEIVSSYAVQFAQITGQDVTSAVINTKEAMEAFGLSTVDIPGIMDAVAKTAQSTGVATSQLFEAVVKGAPQLKSLGLDFAQSTELIGNFEQKGLDSSKALSYLAKAQVSWAKDGKTMADGLDELVTKIQTSGSETDKLTLASEAFGTKGASFMLDAIQRGALSFDDLSISAEAAAGTVSTTFEGTLDPVDKVTVAMNNLKLAGNDLSGSIQEAAVPVLEKLVGILQSLAEWFGGLPDGVKQNIVIFGGLLVALGPIIAIIGNLIGLFGTIATVLPAIGTAFAALSGPIGIVIAAVAAIIAIIILLVKNWDTVKATAASLGAALVNTFDSIKNAISEKINVAKDAVGSAIEKIKSFFNFQWSLPKIKLPHFSISGSFSLNPPSIPKIGVDWYDKGGIFTQPAVIGVGERRPEFVGALDDLRSIVRDEFRGVNQPVSGDLVIEMPVYLEGREITRSTSRIQRQNNLGKARALGVVST